MTYQDYEIVFLFSLLLLLSFVYFLGKKGRKDIKGEEGLPAGDGMKPFLFLKVFYVNPEDPRSWLPKSRPSWGWTINFRNKINALFFLLLLVATVFSALAMSWVAIQASNL